MQLSSPGERVLTDGRVNDSLNAWRDHVDLFCGGESAQALRYLRASSFAQRRQLQEFEEPQALGRKLNDRAYRGRDIFWRPEFAQAVDAILRRISRKLAQRPASAL